MGSRESGSAGGGGGGSGGGGSEVNEDVPIAELRGSVKLRGKSLTKNTSASPIVSGSGGGGSGSGGVGSGGVGGNIHNEDVPLAELRGSVKLRSKRVTTNTSPAPGGGGGSGGRGGGSTCPSSVGNSRRHSRDYDNNHHHPHPHVHANNGAAEGDSAPVGESRGGSVKLRGKRITTAPTVVGGGNSGNGGGVGGGRGGGGGVISPSMSVNDSHVISFDEGVVGDYDGHAHNHRQAKQS